MMSLLRSALTCVLCLWLATAAVCVPACAQEAAQAQPDTKEVELFDFASGLLKRGFYDMAVEEFGKFTARFPESTLLREARFARGEGLFFGKNYDAAVDAFTAFQADYPESPKFDVAQLRKGQALTLAGTYEAAVFELLKVTEDLLTEELRPALHFYLGKAYRGRGDKDKALEQYMVTASDLPENEYTVHAHMETADILAADAQYTAAQEYFAKAHAVSGQEDLKALTAYKQGEMSFLAGNYENSVAAFQSILEHFPEQDIARDALGNLLSALFNLGRFEDVLTAFDAYRDMIRESAPYFGVYLVKANAHAQLSDFPRALETLDQAASFEDLSPDQLHRAHLKKALYLIKSRHFSKLVEFIDENLSDAAKDLDQILFLKAEGYYGLAQFEKAFDAYKDVVDTYPDSPFADDALANMAHAQYALGKDLAALTYFARYFEEGRDPDKRREALYSKILIETKKNKIKEAISDAEAFQEVYTDSEHITQVHFLLGTLYQEDGRYEDAIKVFEAFVTDYPQDERAREAKFLLAYNYQLAGMFDEALAHYDKILDQEVESEFYYSALKNSGLIFLQQEKNDKAAEIFERIMADYPDNDLELKSYLWLMEYYLNKDAYDEVLRVAAAAEEKQKASEGIRGISYFKAEAFRGQEDYESAIKHYTTVLTIGKTNAYTPAARIGLGLSLAALQRYDEAEEQFRQAIEESPDDHTVTMRARFEIAAIRKDRGELEEAAKFYMLVAVLYSDNEFVPKALYRAGSIFEALNKTTEARKAYEDLIASYPDHPLTSKAQERIDQISES